MYLGVGGKELWMLSFDQLAGEAKSNEVEVLLNADFSGSRCLASR